jgi:hypothetical protein
MLELKILGVMKPNAPLGTGRYKWNSQTVNICAANRFYITNLNQAKCKKKTLCVIFF